MNERLLKRKISKLEKQLEEYKEFKNIKKEASKASRRLRIVLEEFEQQGFTKEDVFQILKLYER